MRRFAPVVETGERNEEGGGMSGSARATFEITLWDESTYDEPEDGPKLSRATVKKVFKGEVEGESTAEVLMCQAEGGAGYLASELVIGRVGERTGSFVVQHGGINDGGATRTFGYVVAGSGTGGLRGLRGEAAYQHDEHGASFQLDYDLDPSGG